MNVHDIAKHIVHFSNSLDCHVSNLRLNKMLFLLWIQYYKDTKQYLFENTFVAHPSGPVIPEIHNKYQSLFNAYIPDTGDWNPDETVNTMLIDGYIKRMSSKTTFSLMTDSRKANGSWNTVFCNGEGASETIPFALIIEKE